MRKRIISAIVALVISLPLVYVGGTWFYVFGIVVALLGYREMINLILPKMSLTKVIGYLSFLTILGSNVYKTNFTDILDYRIIGIVFLLFALSMLYKYQDKNIVSNGFYAVAVTLFLGTAFSVMLIVRNMSMIYFIYLFLISILTDTFAHSVGTLLGKYKINEISPKKTWEGCIGGAFFGVLGSTIFYLIMINSEANILSVVGITFLFSCLGQLGDLFFSQIKRHYHIKDFSNIMPGHGGILDRLDSIIFIMLGFTFFITLL